MAKQNNNGFFIELNLTEFEVERVERDETSDFHIYGICTAKFTSCPSCHCRLTGLHGLAEEVTIEHLGIFDKKVWLHVKWPRFFCPNCSKTTQYRPDWLGRTGRMTADLEHFLLKQMVHASIRDVSLKFRITEARLKGVLDQYIQININWNNIQPRVLGLDEISIVKGRSNFLTIVSDLSTPRKSKIITVLRGRSEADVLPFLKKIPSEILANLEAICVDMGGGYQSALKKWLSKSQFDHLVTVDRFHVAKVLGTRTDAYVSYQASTLRTRFLYEGEMKNLIKGMPWLFRKHFNDLTVEERERLEVVFKLLPNLKKLYKLNEEFFEIFEKERSRKRAQRRLNNWCRRANKTGPLSLAPFVKTYKAYEPQILNYFKRGYSSGTVEGMNNKVRLILRRAFGYTNLQHFIQRLFLDFNYSHLLLPETVAL